jgi:hypothetical protein
LLSLILKTLLILQKLILSDYQNDSQQVEDNKINQKVAKKVLEREHFKVLAF